MTRFLALLLVLLLPATPVWAAGEYTIVLKDHEFVPRVLKVQAGDAFVLHLRNDDPTPAAFDSTSLDRESDIVEGNSTLNIKLGPLGAGNYDVFDPFHIGAEGLIAAE